MLAQLRDPARHQREEGEPATFGDVLAGGAGEDAVVDDCAGTKARAGARAARPPAEPDVLAHRPPSASDPVLEAAEALEQVPPHDQVRRLVEAGLPADVER